LLLEENIIQETYVLYEDFGVKLVELFDILGTMNFYDGKTLLGASDFSVVNGQLVERWTDWMVTPGTHNIFAKISNAQKSEIGKPPEPITLATEASATETITPTLDPERLAPTTSTDSSSSSPNPDQPAPLGPKNPESANTLETLVKTIQTLTDKLLGRSSETASTTPNTATDSVPNPISNDNPSSSNTTRGITATISTKLATQKSALDEKLNQEENPQPVTVLAGPLETLAKKVPYFKIPPQYIPSGGRIYSWFLSACIFIVNTWWLLLIVSFLVLRWVWKIVRFFQFRNRDK
jgi:hypothetical protein